MRNGCPIRLNSLVNWRRNGPAHGDEATGEVGTVGEDLTVEGGDGAIGKARGPPNRGIRYCAW